MEKLRETDGQWEIGDQAVSGCTDIYRIEADFSTSFEDTASCSKHS
jgi:hypothetical protein